VRWGSRPATQHYPAAEEVYLASLQYDVFGHRRFMKIGNNATTPEHSQCALRRCRINSILASLVGSLIE
jgi:hypothetical protein